MTRTAYVVAGGAQPADHISAPPAHDVAWRFAMLPEGASQPLRFGRELPPAGDRGVYLVYARTWFAARELAARLAGVDRDRLEVVQ